ncbi:hypothetical protein LCGC14_2209250 [marine sediment metagenome]|uniref:Major tropism determinant N-terminal domain-containing protein n=1 Tax=marine sediment metagenome TaxID=412755 RepID=A0A0F9DEG5_9ZZZZ
MAQTDRATGYQGDLAVKAPVLVASTGNLTLSSTQTIDGIAVSDGDRVLVKDQTTVSENGIYLADTGDWGRDKDFDGAKDVVRGTVIHVSTGSANGDLWFSVTSTGNNIPGTDNITFAQTAGLTATNVLAGSLDTDSNAINFSEGAAVASDSTTNIWVVDGNTVHITGGVSITSLSTAPRIGALRHVIFDSTLVLTAGANLTLPSSTDIVTAANDAAVFYADSTTLIRCLDYLPKDGRPTTRNETLETVSSAGAAISGTGFTVLSSDSTSGTTPYLVGKPGPGVQKDIHLQTSATLITLNTTAPTILFQGTSLGIGATVGSTVLSVSSSAVGISGTIMLRGLSDTVWSIANFPSYMIVSS